MRFLSVLIGAVVLGSLANVVVAQESARAAENRVQAMKQSLAASKVALQQYEWVETVALSLDGEEKVRQQYRCYYGADGAFQKVPVAADAKEESKRGLRGKAAASKKAELQASLNAAVSLLHQYVPLDPAKIEEAKSAGNVSVSLPGDDGRVRLTIKNYRTPGDAIEIEVDGTKDALQLVSITSFVVQGKEKSPVSAKVNYASLTDGTTYPAKESLHIPAQMLDVVIQNSGYRKQAP